MRFMIYLNSSVRLFQHSNFRRQCLFASLAAVCGLAAITQVGLAAPVTSFSEPTTWAVGDVNSTSQQWWGESAVSTIGSNLLHSDNPVIATAPTIGVSSPGFTASSGGYYSFSGHYLVTATIPSYTDGSALGTYVRVQTAGTLNPEYDTNPDAGDQGEYYDPEGDGSGASLFRDGFQVLASDGVTVLATSAPADVARTLYNPTFASSFGTVQYEELLWDVFLPGYSGDFQVQLQSLVHTSFMSLRVDSLVQTPVPAPEPGTCALAGMAGIGLAALRRRLKRSRMSAQV